MQAQNGRLDAFATHIWKSLAFRLSISSGEENNYICCHKSGKTQPITEANVNVITQLEHSKSKQHGYVTRPYQSSRLSWTGTLIEGEQVIHLHWVLTKIRSRIKITWDSMIHFGCLSTVVALRTQRDTSYPTTQGGGGEDRQLSSSMSLPYLVAVPRASMALEQHNTVTGATTLPCFKMLRLVLCGASAKHQLYEEKRTSWQNRATQLRNKIYSSSFFFIAAFQVYIQNANRMFSSCLLLRQTMPLSSILM